jgi:hypothetical protein
VRRRRDIPSGTRGTEMATPELVTPEVLHEVPFAELAGLHVLEAWLLYRTGAPFYGSLIGRVMGGVPGTDRVVVPMSVGSNIKIGQTVVITARPQQGFLAESLLTGPGVSGFVIEDLLINGRSQFNRPFFSGESFPRFFEVLEEVLPGQDISLRVTNVDAGSDKSVVLMIKLDGQLYRMTPADHMHVVHVTPGSKTFEHGDLIAELPPRVLTFHVTEDHQHLYATDEATGLIVLAASDGCAPQFDLDGFKPNWMTPPRKKSGRKKQTREQRKRSKAKASGK